MARSVGNADATSHEPKPISTPAFLAMAPPSGLPAIAVSHNAEDNPRLEMPENMRKHPSRRRDGSPGFAPAASASETTRG